MYVLSLHAVTIKSSAPVFLHTEARRQFSSCNRWKKSCDLHHRNFGILFPGKIFFGAQKNNYASRRSRRRDTVKLTVCVCVCLSVCVSVPAVTAQRL